MTVKSATGSLCLAACLALLVSGCDTMQPSSTPACKPDTVVDGQRFVSDIAIVLGNVPDGPADLWTNEVAAAEAKPETKPAKALGPQADTGKYRDTTDDRKGKLTASGQGFPGEGPENVLDNQQSKWCIEGGSTWLEYAYAGNAKHRVTAYTIMSANDAPDRDPKSWKLQGSMDGENWTDIDSRKDENFGQRFEKRLFVVKTPGEFCAYRLEVAENHGGESSQYAELELLADK